MNRLILAVALAASPVTALAQTTQPTAGSVDPARLDAARGLIDTLMPPATREQMMAGMLQPMMANLQRGMTEDPQFNQAIGSNPRVKALFDDFLRKQNARTVETLRAGLPGMTTAMARAYARRFDVAQLKELRTFFETPTGRAYMQESMTIMADPDVAAWQRSLMSSTMSQVQQDAAAFAQEVARVEREKTP